MGSKADAVTVLRRNMCI